MLIAIIGGIGAGKTTYCNQLRADGCNVLSADEINKELLKDYSYLNKLKRLFPSAFPDGKLNKAILKNIVFSDPIELKKLNNLAHPLIIKELMSLAKKLSGDVYVEMPLFNSYFDQFFDEVYLITASIETRKQRVMARDGISESIFYSILSNQSDTEILRTFATKVIAND